VVRPNRRASSKAVQVTAHFFEWWKSSRPKRRNTAAVLFRTMDPSGLPLPEPLEKKRVDRWLALHDFFVSVAHGALKEEQEIVAAVEEVEQILRDSLYPEPSEDLSAIDAILAEELLGD